jgi:hypothetical protein
MYFILKGFDHVKKLQRMRTAGRTGQPKDRNKKAGHLPCLLCLLGLISNFVYLFPKFLLNPARPVRPEATSSMVAGSGIAAVGEPKATIQFPFKILLESQHQRNGVIPSLLTDFL